MKRSDTRLAGLEQALLFLKAAGCSFMPYSAEPCCRAAEKIDRAIRRERRKGKKRA